MKRFFSNKINMILVVLLLIVIAVGGVLVYRYLNPTLLVPDFSSAKESEIVDWAVKNNISDKVNITYEYDDLAPEGKAYYQSIKAGEEFKDSLQIIISLGPDPNVEMTLPQVDGSLNKEEINKWFISKGFEQVVYQYTLSDQPFDNVLSLNKTSANKFDQIIVSLSAFDKEDAVCLAVPDFSTVSREDASLWASSYEIKLTYNEVASNLPKDTFISQSIVSGTLIKPKDSVQINVSSGSNEDSPNIIVPDSYIGYSENDFIKAIEGLGLVAEKQSKTYETTSMKSGLIYAYDSSSDGLSFKKGDKVKYCLSVESKKTDSINVPDSYLGYEENKFVEAIKALGLDPKKGSKTYKSSKYKTNCIYSYDSSSDGITFKKGDTVNYYLVDNGDDVIVKVPDDYLGLSEAEFIKKIESLGLVAKKSNKTYTSQKYSSGTVYAYDSSSDGITFKKGDTVNYSLVDNGSSSTTVIVPDDYLGLSETEFIKKIESLGLVAKKSSKTYTSAKYSTGTVYTYDSTSDGKTFKKGDTVNYSLVDNGSSTSINVPDSYIGYSEADFIKAIENLGLVPKKGSKTYSSNKYAAGSVYAYDSSSDGISFKKGDTVNYYLVEKDPGISVETVTLSDFSGKTKDEAESYCKQNGLVASFENSSSSSVEQGRIISMNPSSGSVVNKGSTIKFVVSSGVSTIKVLSLNLLQSNYSKDTYSASKDAITSYFTSQGFTNLEVKSTSSQNLSSGVIASVSINGSTLSSGAAYPSDANIIVYIVE